MFKAYLMAEDQNEKVRDILLLPTAVNDQLHDSASEQIADVVDFLHGKLSEYQELITLNCRSVFVVNYVQNQFIATEFCPEIGKLFEVLKVKTYEELNEKLDSLKEDSEMKPSVVALMEAIQAWNSFLKDIDDDLDKTLGAIKSAPPKEPEDSGLLGLQSKTISYYVTGSAFDCVLIIVVRSFNKPEVNEHILGLYNRIEELRKLRCDVFLLTKGPPIGSRGGAYIKLIGVPFRKLYDMNEAENELKMNRKSAVKYTSWEQLCRVVEASFSEDGGPQASSAINDSEGSEDSVAYISQKGGTVLVDKTGAILYKHIEDERTDSWPNIDEIVKIVETRNADRATTTTAGNGNPPSAGGKVTKVNSETSVGKETQGEKKKQCCIIC